ncbi:MAG: hypothetical protein OXM55_06405 [Bdellovibrionales bacterium]|nr:hypothetical protein [Bdellovibrionales bacterium]
MEIPKFSLYGVNDPKIRERIQITLPWRSWDMLTREEKETALQELENNELLSYNNILITIKFLNKNYLRKLYGKNLHRCDNNLHHFHYVRAAVKDFSVIFLTEKSDVVLCMLSVFAKNFIDECHLNQAEQSDNYDNRKKYIELAYAPFYRLQNCVNHIFDQFCVNQVLTRSGFVPRQDKRVLDQIYTPTIKCLSDPKWSLVDNDLRSVFQDYRNGDYQEAITKAHSVVHRFLQIYLNKGNKNHKGELGKLFQEFKRDNIISDNVFVIKIIDAVQSFVSSERANKSTAKPASKNVTSSDALLVVNAVMIFLQYCLKAN